MGIELKAMQDFVLTLGYPVCVSIAMYFLLRASTSRSDRLAERFVALVERLMAESASSRATITDNTTATRSLSVQVEALAAGIGKVTPCRIDEIHPSANGKISETK